MSMENAILELAAALKEQAAAIREGNEVQRATAAGYERAVTAYAAGSEKLVDDKAAELADATKQRAAAAKAATAADAKANEALKKDDEIEQAVAKVEADAERAEAKDNQAGPTGADDADLGGPLDYVKDVRPVLLAAIKKAGKDKVAALIATFGADKAEKIDPAKFGELLAGAQKLAA